MWPFLDFSGIQIAMHKENKGPKLEEGLIPVEFISYGVQDIQFTRVFSFIVVKVRKTSQTNILKKFPSLSRYFHAIVHTKHYFDCHIYCYLYQSIQSINWTLLQ